MENAPRFDPNGPVQAPSGNGDTPIKSDSPDLPPPDDQLQLETLDLPAILAHGQRLLGSAGREYDAAWATMDPASRLADQKKRLMARLGLGGDYMEEDLVNETDFAAGTGSTLKLDTFLGRTARQPSVAHPGPAGSTTPSSATPASAVGLDETGLSKRQLNQLKRKNKLFAKNPACKIRVVDLAIHRRPSVDHVDSPGQSEPTPIKAEPESDALSPPAFVEDGSPIVAAYRGPAGPDPSPLRTESAGDRDEWPFERLCDLLMLDLFDATWEVRHGAAMGLRELVRVHGAGAGRESGRSRPVNDLLNQRWLADLACRVCCVFILDRFGDYVSDTVVAPIRETVGQTLGALMVHLSASSVRRVYAILHRLVMQDDLGRTHRVWEVGHGGMIGLRYLVAVRNDLLMSDDHLIDGVLQAATRGLADVDDDVRAVSATTLIPIAAEIVTLRPAIVRDVVQVIWDCLADVKDDLSASTGSVMDLLARLCAFPPVLEAMTANAQADPGHGFATLVPRLYPFLRHTITTVRAAVLRALLAFLRLGRDDVTAWASGKALGLVFQNLLVERNDEVARLSEQVWVALVGRIHRRGPHELSLASAPYITTLMALAFHPIGIPLFPWPMDPSCFLRPSALEQADGGGPMATTTAPLTSEQIGAFRPLLSSASGPPSAATEPSGKRRRKPEEPAPSAHNVDAHMMQGEVELVGFEVMLRSRIGTARAMGTAMRCWDASTTESIVKPSIEAGLRSPFWTSQTFALMMVEEYACSTLSPWPDGSHLAARLPPIDTGVSPAGLPQRLAMDVRTVLEEDRPPAYRELVPLARSVRALCHALRTEFRDASGIPSSKIPSTAVVVQGDADAGPEAFSMVEAERIVGPEFDRLKQAMAPAQRIQCLPVLMAAREQALQSLEQVQQAKARADVRVLAAAAAALVALGDLPSKPSRMIKGIMDSVKTEGTVELQHRSAAALAALVKRYVDGGRRGPVDKIISNLVKFSCVDLSETPDFRRSQALTTVVLSLRKEEDRRDHVDAAKFEQEARQARIMRRGAKDALNLIARRFGGELLSKVPMLQGLMEDALREVFADDRDVLAVTDPDRELGQQVIDGLSTIRTLVASLDVNLHPFVLGMLPLIVKALHHPLSVIRYAAAKCLASTCGVITIEGMTFLVERVLPLVGHPVEVEYRQGGIECIYRESMRHLVPESFFGAPVLTGLVFSWWGGGLGLDLVHVMQDHILPYVVFLIVPVLGRMSDSDTDVRLLATTTFATLVKLVPLEAGIPDPPGFPEALLRERDHERRFIAQMLDVHQVEPFEIPVAIKAQLRPYQQEGVNWLAFLNRYHLHGILCDDMGLGKTLQTLCIVASDHHIRAETFEKTGRSDVRRLPSLIVCPPTLSGHWEQEIRTFAPFLTSVSYVGSPSIRQHLQSRLGQTDIVITSYDICRNDIDVLAGLSWNYCVLDEGHLIKNPKTKITMAVKRLKAEHRLILSGTPIQNNVLELWSLFDFLMPGFLGTEKVFADRFAKPIAASRHGKSSSKEQEAGALAIEALHKQVLPFLLRRLKEEVLEDLPPKIIQNYYCDLSDLQKKLFEDFNRREGQSLAEKASSEDKGAKQHIFQALQYMRKLCNSPALVVKANHKHFPDVERYITKHRLPPLHDVAHAPKLMALRDLLLDCGIGTDDDSKRMNEMSTSPTTTYVSQHRALIFCQMKEMLDIVQGRVFGQLLPSVQFLRLDGSVEANKRQEIVNRFNSDPSYDVLLLTTSVGGLGLNLTGADTVIFVEHDWNPQKDLQAMDRAHRIGQKKVVNVYRLISRGTLEEKILRLVIVYFLFYAFNFFLFFVFG